MAPVLAVLLGTVSSVTVQAQGHSTASGVTQVFAERWAQNTSNGLRETLDPNGVLLALEGREHRDLDAARLLATVNQVRSGSVGGSVRLLRVVPVAGSEGQAFAELLWEFVMVGTSESVQHTIYLGLVHHDERWWVSEIRLLS